ncbi:MAG: class II aldolase [Alphaproteobacteria bacterium]|nr:class II aldolase [Alphaproteobacteria bacterium]
MTDPESDLFLHQQIIDTAQALAERGLSPGLSGNLSARVAGGMLITPSAMAYDELLPDDIVFVAQDGSVRPGQRKPSNETPFHRAVFAAYPDAHAVLHCHSPKATALACLRKPIPAFHYMVSVAGGDDIRVADYFTPATQQLAEATVKALEGRKACLLANHGQVAFGNSLEEALALACEVENLASMYLDALSAGEPQILSAAEMADVRELFKTYRP